jgi:hypothetical protein
VANFVTLISRKLDMLAACQPQDIKIHQKKLICCNFKHKFARTMRSHNLWVEIEKGCGKTRGLASQLSWVEAARKGAVVRLSSPSPVGDAARTGLFLDHL